MKDLSGLLFGIFIFLMLIYIVQATIYPFDNFDFDDTFAIWNVTNLTSTGNITANEFIGQISCTQIYNGSDGDFCSDAGGAGKNASGPYLYNDTYTIYLNETYLNLTIDYRENDTTYSHLTNFTDDLGNRGYTHLTNFTNDLGYTHLTNFTDDLGNRGYTHLTNFTDDLGYTHLTNFTDDLGNRGYTHLTNFTNDLGYTHLSNFTDDLGHLEDNTSWNESYADTLYAAIGSSGGHYYYPEYVNLTAGTYNGHLTNGSKVGYDAGNEICSIEFPNSHLCTEFEIMLWFSNSTDTSLNNEDAWCNAGGPKYVPADIPVNDCNGWTHGSAGTYLGNYYHFNSTSGGDGRAVHCGTTLKLACCSY